jgi:ssDNA thymidine ADP-ribosyltransferase, DarT
MTTIQEECAKLNIDRLFHFTPVDHLDSILQRGLLVPSACKAQNFGMKANDAVRYDRKDALCLSVEWPNWQLYWNFHLLDKARPWAIIQLHHAVLWNKRVCFNTTNAADNTMSSQTFEVRQGVVKFLEMFEDWGDKKRANLDIEPHLTTNPQAEVLCLDSIEPAYFTAVHLDNYEVSKHYKAAYPGANVRYDSTYFKYRSDWRHW